MSYKGTVKNGVVVLEPGASLPEGTEVQVEPKTNGELLATDDELEDDPLIRMLKHAGPTGILDLSINADHYLYGHPKVSDGH
jgi:hypothetical protein